MNLWIDCERKPITELLEFIVDNRGKSVPTTEKGHILIATNCIRNDFLYPKYEKIRYLSQETYESFFRAHPLPGDIIFVNKGTPGRVCLVPDPIDFCIAQDMIALRANRNLVDNHYLLAVLRTPTIQTQIHNTYVGDVIPHFKKQFMDRLLIPLPSMNIQKKIGDIYYTLCDKIEVNRRINAELEELAQALFKSWFVDFEPFKEEEFVESELGMIPKGWKVGSISEICDVLSGFAFKSSSFVDEGNYRLITIKGVQDGCLEINGAAYIDEIPSKMPNYCSLNIGDILLSLTGNVGRCCYVHHEDLLLNQRVAKLYPKNCNDVSFIYTFFRKQDTKTLLELMARGTAQANLSPIETSKMKVVLPDRRALDEFGKICNPLFWKMINNQQEITHLTALRDALLPKLMSGEIDVNEVEI